MAHVGSVSSIRIDGDFHGGSICAVFLSWLGKRLGFTVSGSLNEHSSYEKQPPIILGPQALSLFRKIGLDERDMLKACAGTFVVGAEFEHDNINDPGFAPYLTSVAPIDGIAFHQIYGAARSLHVIAPYSDYFAPLYLAKGKRFSHPIETQPVGRASFRYNLILERALFEDYMRRAAKHYGFRSETQNDADLILKADNNPLQADGFTKISPNTTMPSHIKYRVKNSAIIQIIQTQTDCLETLFPVENQSRKTQSDICQNVWQDNVINLSDCLRSLLPYDHTYMDAIASLLLSLFDLWPDKSDTTINAAEFNRRVESSINRAKDFQSALCVAAGLIDIENTSQPFKVKWQQFLSRGRLVSYDDEPVSDAEWIAYLLALGIIPERVDPLTGKFTPTQMTDALNLQKDISQKWGNSQAIQTEYLGRAKALYAHKRSQ